MDQKPLVTIVTPSMNQARYLEETMLSVLNQDYPNIEYIVMDGGSNDGSVETIKKYEKRLAYWESIPDKGQTDALNKGFARANGQILAWLNSDDVYYPWAVREAVDYMLEHPEYGLIYSGMDFIDENSQVIGKFNAAQTDLQKMRRGYVHLPQPASFFRADLWKQVGPLDTSFFFAMDYDLWIKLAQITAFKYIPDKLWAKFRMHMDAKTIYADSRCWQEMLRVHYRDGGSFFSVIVLKSWIRKLASPWINRKRQKMFTK